MKVLQVLNHFLPQQTAGTEIYAWALSKELKNQGVFVKVVIPHYSKTSSTDYVYDGIDVHQFAEPSVVDRSLIMGIREPDGLKNFTLYLNQENPDIVHFHELAGSNGIGLTHVRAAKKHGAKVIMTFHLAGYTCVTDTLMYRGKIVCDGKINTLKCSNCYLHKKGMGIASPILASSSMVLKSMQINSTKWGHSIGTALGTAYVIQGLEKRFIELVQMSDQVVCITNWYHDVLKINGVPANKVSYISQGLPIEVKKSPNKKRLPSKPIRLLFLGRISPFKGLHLLLEALESFPESAFELSIFGPSDGTNYETEWRTKTKERGNIQWKGILKQEMVQQEMSQHDLLCLCSTFSEMSPLVIQEARAVGLPLLASNAIGNREQFDNGAKGFLFEMNSVVSLIKQLKKIQAAPDQLRTMAQSIQEPSSFSDLSSEYMKLYYKILQQ